MIFFSLFMKAEEASWEMAAGWSIESFEASIGKLENIRTRLYETMRVKHQKTPATDGYGLSDKRTRR